MQYLRASEAQAGCVFLNMKYNKQMKIGPSPESRFQLDIKLSIENLRLINL